MATIALVAVVLVAGVGDIIAIMDLARRETGEWLRVAWVAVILSFPFFGPAAYASVDQRPDVFSAWQRAAAAICAIAAAAALFWSVQQVLPPFLIAFFLAALLDPLVSRLQTSGVSRVRAVASIYVLAVLSIVIVGWLIVPLAMRQMGELVSNASGFATTLTNQADRWYGTHERLLSRVGWTHKPSVMLSSAPAEEYLKRMAAVLSDTLRGVAGQIIWLIIIPLSLFYFLMDFQHLRTGLLAFVSDKQRAGVDRITSEIVEVFSHYARSLAIVCVLYGATFAVVFSMFGLRYAVFVGIAAGVLYAVPYVGPAVTLTATVVISLAMGRSVTLVVITASVYIAIHCTFDYVITPRVVGGSVGLHPIVNVFALMAGATLFGVWGMLLAVPVAASIQKLLLNFYPGLFARERKGKPRGRKREGDVPAAT